MYKISAKKVQRSYVSWHLTMMQNLKKNWFFVSKMTRIWWILIRALESVKNLHFDWLLLCKVYNVWFKKVRRSYFTWHWIVMQNLQKNWLAVWKMTWGIWQIFIRALESLQIGTLMWSFSPKYKLRELKFYLVVMCNGTEKWCKIWRGIDLSFQNWHKGLMDFESSTQKSQKSTL